MERVIYRKAATRATMAPSPPRATVFRLAAPGSVPVAVGGVVPVVTVPLPALVADGASVFSAADVSADVGASVVSVDGAVLVAAGADVEAGAEEAALVSGERGGTLRETPALAQSWEAASMVPWISASEHPAWTQGIREETKELASQMQAKSVL
jgi:hypothetical protein